jgi:hypothetical protein
MRDIQNLLNQISIISKKNSEILEASGGRFNMFGVLGVDHYENTHSSIICEFLNPKGSHGLKDQFLNAFIELYQYKFQPSKYLKELFKTETAQSYTEYPTQDGRIDILIEDNNGHAIIIENKIYALDQWEQLKRYNQFALIKYEQSNYLIFYLTLNGTEASKDSGEGVDYIQISYSEFIIDWLEKCVSIASRFPLVRETIIQYINHLKNLTNQDMNTIGKEEIVRVLSLTEENMEAAFSINENIGALKDHIVSNYFNPQLQEIANELGIILTKKLEGRGTWERFHFDVPEWKSFEIYFEFQSSDWMKLAYMYRLKSDCGCPNETKSVLYPKFGHHNSNLSFPLGWSDMPKYFYWNTEAFLAIRSGEMKVELKRIIIMMIEQAKALEM